MNENNINARRDTRISKSLTVKFRPKDEEFFQKAVSIDISRSGIFIRTDSIVPVDTEVEIQLFDKDSDNPLHFNATVTRVVSTEENSSAPGIGIKITKIPDTENEKFKYFFDLLNNYGWFC